MTNHTTDELKEIDSIRSQLEEMAISLRSGSQKGRHVTGVFDLPLLAKYIDSIITAAQNQLLDLVENGEGLKNVYTLEEVAEMNKHLDSRTQQHALAKSEGTLEANNRWRSHITTVRKGIGQ